MGKNLINKHFIFFVFCLAVICLSNASVSATLDVNNSLTGHWKFDEGSGTVVNDSSGYNNTGTLLLGPTWTNSSKIRSFALSFDGLNDYVSLNRSPITNFSTPNSACSWIYSNNISYTIGGDAQTIFSFYNNSGNNLIAYISTGGGITIGYRSSTTNYGKYSSNNIINNAWFYFCYTWNGTNVALYSNGASVNLDGDASNTAQGNFVGSRSGAGGTGLWYGKIQDIRVYNKTLNSSEINELYVYTLTQVNNQAPNVFGSSSTRVVLPSSLMLNDYASDDDLPLGSNLTYEWSVINGTGSVNFGSVYSAVTSVNFSSAGNYTLRLTTNDSELTSYYDTEVMVLPSPITLNVKISGTGTGNVTGNGINCGNDCTRNYGANTSVVLTATSSPGSNFITWIGGGCSGNGTCIVDVNYTRTVTAYFDLNGTGNRTFYVDTKDPIANDSNSGNESFPWKTIQYAASNVTAGDKIIVKAGEYNEFITFTKNGTTNNPIIFEGERDVDGNWLTIIDPSTNISDGWSAAPEIGYGVFKRNLTFQTHELTINGKRIAFVYTLNNISDEIANSYVTNLTNGSQIMSLSSDYEFTLKGSSNVIRFWDGIEALWSSSGNTTYLRLRNGSNPNGLNIRSAPNLGPLYNTVISNPAIDLESNHVNIRNFLIRGAFANIILNGNWSANIIESNYLSNGYSRITLENNASNNVIRNNEITTNYYGYDDPGSWGSNSEYKSLVRENHYLVSKYLMGQSSSFDESISLSNAGENNSIYENHIFKGFGSGIALGGNVDHPINNTKIHDNLIENHPSIGILLSEGHTGTEIYDNYIHDNNINIRFHHMDNSLETNRVVYIYRNEFWLPDNVGNQIYVHYFNNNSDVYFPEFWVYHNSFSGGEYVFSISSYILGGGGLRNLRVINNVLSGAPYVNDGEIGISFLTNASMMGVFDYNIVTPPSLAYPAYEPPAWYGSENTNLSSAIWDLDSIPDFVLESSSLAIDSGIDLSHNFTINGTNYTALPGMNVNYYSGSAPDIGALEYVDEIYPIFSNYLDNNATLIDYGIAIFNVTVQNTNGSVILQINNVNYTAINLTANVYNVSVNLTNGTYSYFWTAYGNGTSHNYNTSSLRSYTVNASSISNNNPGSGGSSGGGSGGAGTTGITYTITSRQFKEGYNQRLAKSDKIKFPFSFLNHSVIVDYVGNSSINITVNSSYQKSSLIIGESKKFELNGDNYYDLIVTLNSISGSKANLSVQEIPNQLTNADNNNNENQNASSEENLVNEENENQENNPVISDEGNKNLWIVLLIAVIIAVILILIVLNFLVRKEQKNSFNDE